MSSRLSVLAVPVLVLLASSVRAEAPRYRNFELAIYCPARDLRQMADGDWSRIIAARCVGRDRRKSGAWAIDSTLR